MAVALAVRFSKHAVAWLWWRRVLFALILGGGPAVVTDVGAQAPNPWAAPQTGRDAARMDPRFDTRFAPDRYDPTETVPAHRHGGRYPYTDLPANWREPDSRWVPGYRTPGRTTERDYPPMSWPPLDQSRERVPDSRRGSPAPRDSRDDSWGRTEIQGVAEPRSFDPGGWSWLWSTPSWGTREGIWAVPGLGPYPSYPGTGMLYPGSEDMWLDWTSPWLGLYPFWLGHPTTSP